jgi:hypothetical protein
MSRRVLILVMAVLLIARAGAAEGAEPPAEAPGEQGAILVLGADDITTVHLRQLTEAFTRVILSDAQPRSVHFESFDAPRLADGAYLGQLWAWLQSKYEGRRIDMIVAVARRAFIRTLTAGLVRRARLRRASRRAEGPLLPLGVAVAVEDHFAASLAVIRPSCRTLRTVLAWQLGARLGPRRDSLRRCGPRP